MGGDGARARSTEEMRAQSRARTRARGCPAHETGRGNGEKTRVGSRVAGFCATDAGPSVDGAREVAGGRGAVELGGSSLGIAGP